MEQGMFRLKIWEVVLLVVVIGVLITSVAAQNTQAALSEKVVRLHVLANSDTEEDQNLKLMVRDAILEHTEQLLKSTESRKEAEALLRGQLLELEQVASETIRIAGFEYPVSVELTETAFPTKEYDGFSLPAGEYLSLRVLIGNALGQNWWCVVFPPLCTAVAAEVPNIAREAGFSEEEVALFLLKAHAALFGGAQKKGRFGGRYFKILQKRCRILDYGRSKYGGSAVS